MKSLSKQLMQGTFMHTTGFGTLCIFKHNKFKHYTFPDMNCYCYFIIIYSYYLLCHVLVHIWTFFHLKSMNIKWMYIIVYKCHFYGYIHIHVLFINIIYVNVYYLKRKIWYVMLCYNILELPYINKTVMMCRAVTAKWIAAIS